MEQQTQRVRRQHSTEFKHRVMAACAEPGASVAGVALAHGVNANLVRRWLREPGVVPFSGKLAAPVDGLGFMPIRIDPLETPPRDIRLELRRGGSQVTIDWPVQAASELGAWLQAWLR